ncbi:hypothetical protein EV383_2032 [Pseudonocardia sediminis]|uniref:Cell division protein FtsL n=1 Tax=Pseudonocardia sediminis TaxID=1397368 RepID=A0A4Q7UW23_PSEST|nr:hypothetical protein [Pseudonocardia sediminis]RZT85168.1 hypothetical protein EV383_2032 [Pseudonocardia sediminis]
MSTPVIERRGGAPAREQAPRRSGAVAPGRIPVQRGANRVAALKKQATTRKAGAGAQRARDQRDDRLRRIVGARAQASAGRAKFVLVVMTLLVIGLVTTLWLSTAAAGDSYRLQEARAQAQTLTEQSETLRRQVSTMNSPAALAQRASALGLVPVQDPARLVVAPDGRIDVVGEPTAAHATAPAVPAAPATGAPAGPAPAAAAPAAPAPSTAPAAPAAAAPAAAAPAAAAAGTTAPPADTSDTDAAPGATQAG